MDSQFLLKFYGAPSATNTVTFNVWVGEQTQALLAGFPTSPADRCCTGYQSWQMRQQERDPWEPSLAILTSPLLLLASTSLSPAGFGVCTNAHLHLFLILESSLAHYDVFNTPSITELLLKDGIVFKEFLGLLL